jgi:hypothetical protein
MDGLENVGGTAVVDAGTTADPSAGSSTTELEAPASTETTDGGTTTESTGTETVSGGGESEGELGSEDELSQLETDSVEAPSGAEAQIRQKISELKKTNPEAAKQWAADHYSLGAYKKEFQTVQEARSAKATIESLGGEDGINDMQGEIADWRKEADQFASGDRSLLEQLYQENPEATVTAAHNALELLMEKDHQKFADALIPSMHAQVESVGVYEAFSRIGATLNVISKAIEEGDGQKAYDLLQKVLNPNVDYSFAKMDAWFKHLANQAKESGEKRTANKVDPERQALDRERQEFESSKQKENSSRISEGVSKMNSASISKVTAQFFKDMKMSSDARKDFVDGLSSRIYKKMEQDKTYQRQANAKLQKGDNEATIRFMNAKFLEFLPEAFRALRNTRYPNWKPGQGAAKPNGAAANGNGNGAAASSVANGSAVSLEQARQVGVDWNKTSNVQWIAAMSGKGSVWLKNGKQVSIRA